jgi:hypothetical protein
MGYRLARKEFGDQGDETFLFFVQFRLTLQIIQHCIQWVPLGWQHLVLSLGTNSSKLLLPNSNK